MELRESEQRNEIRRKEYAAIEEKMKDPVWFTNFRQEQIKSVFEKLNRSSSFCFQSSNGQDALIMAMDNLIKAQLN